jgi:hypothetical protein
MEDKFDNYIASLLKDTEDSPVSNIEWNQESVWNRINQNIQYPVMKLVPRYWLYIAAGFVLLLTIPPAIWISVQKQKSINELQHRLSMQGKITEKRIYVPQVVSKTIYQRVTDTVYVTRTEIVYNTVWKTDTLMIAMPLAKTEIEKPLLATNKKSKRRYVDYIDSTVTDIANSESEIKPRFQLSANPNEGYVSLNESYLFKSTIQ